jgi:ABC-type iron transport system FetAB ATPase subunit
MNVKIGDSVTLVAPSGASRGVMVTDVIRFGSEVLALEFQGRDGFATLPIRFFRQSYCTFPEACDCPGCRCGE